MSQFVEVNTVGLTGPTLDWAVAKVIGHSADWERSSGCLWFESNDHEWLVWSPSTNWAQGGTLIDEFGVWLSDDECNHIASTSPHVNEYIVIGPTKLVAACRAIVAAKLGDVVQVPAELAGVAA